MKKLFFLILCFTIMFSLCGCAKCISTEITEVEVKITDEYHRGMYMTPIRSGKVTTFVTHPEVYRITVEYNENEYTISGRDTYNSYKDKVGETAIGILETKTYDDESVKYDIISLK